MSKWVVSVSVLLISIQGWAQSDYVVTAKGDTLRGEVRILTYDLIDRVQVKVDKNKEIFTAIQVRSVFLENEKYQPVKIENSIRLMKSLKGGYLSLFAFRLPNQNSYDGRYLVKLGGSSMEVPNLTFKKLMTSYLEDCPVVSEKIKSGELSKSNLDQILDEYNRCIEDKSNATASTTVVPAIDKGTEESLNKIELLKAKVEGSNLEAKKDVLDLLNDLKLKVSKKESVPNYLIEGLKSYLADKEEFTNDLNEVIRLVKK